MHTGHNNERHESGQNRHSQPRYRVVHRHKDAGHGVAENITDGAQHIQGARQANDQEQQRLQEGFQHVGGYLIRKIFRPFHDRSHQQRRQDRQRIGGVNLRDTEQIGTVHSKEGTQF